MSLSLFRCGTTYLASADWSQRCAACASSSSTTGRRPRCSRADFASMHCDVQVLRHARSKGPGRRPQHRPGRVRHRLRRVPGLRRGAAPRVAGGAARPLLRSRRGPGRAAHRRPAQADNLVARYEAVRSSLDLGLREAPVVPYGTVSYVPSAAIICRRTVLKEVGGFDETLQVRRRRRPVLAVDRSRRPVALRTRRAGRPRPPHPAARVVLAQVFLRRIGRAACRSGIPARPRRW